MGGQMSRNEFEWVYTEQPHVSRRKLILEKHPEIKRLMGPDPLLKYQMSALVLLSLASSYYVSRVLDLSYFWTTVLAYFVGGFINHSILLGIHESSHNFVFGQSRPLANRLFGMWANLPITLPMSMSFKKYHIQHHRYLAMEGYDVDLPTELEAKFFHNMLTKALWLILQPVFYLFRPLVVRPMPLSKLEILNVAIQLAFDVLLVHFCGFKALYYLFMSLFLSSGLHPMATHFITDHYMFDKGAETYSYYGPLNYFTWNVGLHMEHHDFPYIPGMRLPEVRRIAPEFYEGLPQHKSLLNVFREFLFNPECGPYGRVKRHYEDIYGERKEDNPHLNADNSTKPVLSGHPTVPLKSE